MLKIHAKQFNVIVFFWIVSFLKNFSDFWMFKIIHKKMYLKNVVFEHKISPKQKLMTFFVEISLKPFLIV